MFPVLFGILLILPVDVVKACDQRGPKPPPPRRDKADKPVRDIVRIKVESGCRSGENLRLKCLVKGSSDTDITWAFGDEVLSRGKRVMIKARSNVSTLTIRKVQARDSGWYSCVAKFNKTADAAKVFVGIKPRPVVKIIPRSSIIQRGESVVLQCKNIEANSTVLNITWSRKQLRGGKWQTVGKNTEYFMWVTEVRSGPFQAIYDVYDVFCDVTTTDDETIRSLIAKVIVINKGTLSSLNPCPADVAEGIQWNTTLIGMEDVQPCYSGKGEARRRCNRSPDKRYLWRWRRPNLRHCHSPHFSKIDDEIAASDEGFKVDLNISKVLSDLSSWTKIVRKPGNGPHRSARLFGNDLLSSVKILRRTKDFIKLEKESPKTVKENFLLFSQTASNLLDVENKYTWEEVDQGKPDTAVQLISALDEFGFEVDTNNDNIMEAREKNLVYQIRRGSSADFKKYGYTFRQDKSHVSLPSAFFEKSSSDHITVISVIYDTLSSILPTFNNTQSMNNLTDFVLLNNSKIISSSVKPLGKEVFREPIRITLENDVTSIDGYVKRHCVFWEPENENSSWSEKGCRVIAEETNDHVTTCECNHLTLFAVMVESSEISTDARLSTLDIISTVGSAISLTGVVLTTIIYLLFWGTLKSPRVINLMNLCVAIGLLDVFSAMRSPFKENQDVCRAIGVLLHYFVLALFLWMLCEAILLYLMLTEIFKKHYGRKWYIFVFILGWGCPGLIVAISAGIAGSSQYGTDSGCWLSRSNGFIWAALGPMTLVLLVNCVVYFVMLRQVLHSRKWKQQDTTGKLRAGLRASIVILPILGLTWILAVLDFFLNSTALKYLFAILNSLQGFFIFLFHCLLNQQVRQALFKIKKRRKSILDRVKTQETRL